MTTNIDLWFCFCYFKYLYKGESRISASSKVKLFVSLINGYVNYNVKNNILDVGFHRFRLDFRFLEMALKDVYKCIICNSIKKRKTAHWHPNKYCYMCFWLECYNICFLCESYLIRVVKLKGTRTICTAASCVWICMRLLINSSWMQK